MCNQHHSGVSEGLLQQVPPFEIPGNFFVIIGLAVADEHKATVPVPHRLGRVLREVNDGKSIVPQRERRRFAASVDKRPCPSGQR